jgi:hypothetical protein
VRKIFGGDVYYYHDHLKEEELNLIIKERKPMGWKNHEMIDWNSWKV